MSTRGFTSPRLSGTHGPLNSGRAAKSSLSAAALRDTALRDTAPDVTGTPIPATPPWRLSGWPGGSGPRFVVILCVWAGITAAVCATGERWITSTLIKVWDAALGSHDDETLRVAPSPHTRAQEAYAILNQARAHRNPQNVERARQAVDWFVQNASVMPGANGGAVWPCSYAYSYNTKPMWRSALTQTEIASLMLDAEEVLGDANYRHWAQRALQPLFADVASGGVRVVDGPQSWWYEEYADESVAPPRVLNGMQYALLYLHSVWRRTGDPQAKLLFDNGLRSLHRHLADYDAGSWTFYDAQGYMASPEYHKVHIKLLGRLYAVTGDSELGHFQKKWQAYGGGFWKRFYSNLTVWRLNNSQIGVLGASAMMSLLVTLMGAWVLGRVRREPVLA